MRETHDSIPALPPKEPSAADIKAFLLANPERFAGDGEVLAALLPEAEHASNVHDLQRHVIARLRQELALVRAQGQAFIEAAAANLLAQERVHSAVLRVLEARSLSQLLRIVSLDLAPLMGADLAALGLEAPESPALNGTPPQGIFLLAEGSVDKVLGPGMRHALNAGPKRLPGVYGRQARKVRSEALLRLSLGRSAPAGLLVLGSFDPETFAPGQRMELLDFLARVVERSVRVWLEG